MKKHVITEEMQNQTDTGFHVMGLVSDDDKILSDYMKSLRQKIYEETPGGRKFGTDIIEVNSYVYDFDNECREDFLHGKGLRIESVDSFDKKNKKIHNGLQSEFFGSDFGDDLAFAERYSCACGKKIGQMYDGEVCPECGTQVQYSEVDLTKFGWIMLEGGFKVINPAYYAKLESIFGKLDAIETVVGAIIKIHYKDDDNNNLANDPHAPCLDDKDKMHITKHPFIRRGTLWLEQNLPTVLEYYAKIKPGKKDAIQEIYDNIDKIFCSCIPVYTSVLRMEAPSGKDEKTYRVRTNTCYRSIIRSVNRINEIVRSHNSDDCNIYEDYSIADITTIDRFTAQAQSDMRDLYEELFKIISGKAGYILSKITAGRYNYSARNIIISGNRALHSDEVEVCYSTFIELFRPELTNYYAKFNNCTIVEANDAIIQGQSKFNKQIYYTMLYMIKTNKIYIIVNRNPLICGGGIAA